MQERPVGVVVMGPCGSGKSEIGSRLSLILSLPFVDADDLHPPSNVDKMAKGIPLSDEDRFPWLVEVRREMERVANVENKGGVVVACSALKKSYRDVLRGAEGVCSVFAYLSVPRGVLEERLRGREGHFMKGAMLESQLQSLEEPPSGGEEEERGDTLTVIVDGIETTVEEVVNNIVTQLKERENKSH